MPYTAEQEAEFKRTFSSRRRRQLMVTIPFVVILVSLTVAGDRGDLFGVSLSTILPTLLILVAAVLIFSFRNWRCPACDKYLGKSINPKFCQKCGVALR